MEARLYVKSILGERQKSCGHVLGHAGLVFHSRGGLLLNSLSFEGKRGSLCEHVIGDAGLVFHIRAALLLKEYFFEGKDPLWLRDWSDWAWAFHLK